MSPGALPYPWHSARALAPLMGGAVVSNLYRSVNGVVVPYVMHDLGFGVDKLGLLTGVYVLAFAVAQLPVGALLGRARMRPGMQGAG